MGDMILFSVRIDDTARRKLRIIAGYEDVSMNTVITNAIDKEIADWEEKHGAIEIPNK